MSKHTPGSWEYSYQSDDEFYDITDEIGLNVAIVTCRYEAKANAKLIAAAPDLLEALQHIEKMQLRGFIVLGEEATNKMQAAIKKATN